MKRVGLAVTAALLNLGNAEASPTTWFFTYSNLCDVNAECRSLDGFFSGEDLNHDQKIARSELSYFVLNDRKVFPEFRVVEDGYSVAGYTYSFEYAIDGDLSFDAASVEYKVSWGWRTGDGMRAWVEGEIDYAYFWNESTTLSITTIPESSAALQLCLGLAALGALSRLRKNRIWPLQLMTAAV